MFSGKSAKNSAILFYIETSIILGERKYLATVHTIIGGADDCDQKNIQTNNREIPRYNFFLKYYEISRDEI